MTAELLKYVRVRLSAGGGIAALLVVSGLGVPGSAWGDRIAVLDLEGPPAVAPRISAALGVAIMRTRAHKLIPGKPLDEAKLVFGCMNEEPDCMAAVGKSLRADKLIWGKVKPKGTGYRVRLKLLEVGAKAVQATRARTLSAEESKAPTTAVERLVRALLAIKKATFKIISTVKDVEVRVGGRRAGEATGRVFVLRDMRPGKHEIEVNREGYLTWRRDVVVQEGSHLELMVDLQPVAKPLDGSSHSRTAWETTFWISALAALGIGVGLIPNGLRIGELEDSKEEQIQRIVDEGPEPLTAQQREIADKGCDASELPNGLQSICDEGRGRAIAQNVLIGVSAALAVLAGVSFYEAFLASEPSDERPDADVAGGQVRWRVAGGVSPRGASITAGLQF